MVEKEFDPDMLYGRIIRHYMDKKGYDREKANRIARYVVQRETQRRICRCSHFLHDHLKDAGICLADGCTCSGFVAGFNAGNGDEEVAKIHGGAR